MATYDSLTSECSVCFEDKALKLLSCFHRFCADCITECVENTDDGADTPCPTCQQPIFLPGGDARNLPIVCVATSEVPSKCMCEQEVTHVCVTCPKPEFLAGMCLEFHRKQQATRDHEIVTLAEWRAGDRTSIERRSRGVCKQHRGEEVKFYCTQCKQPACSTCQVLSHNDHIGKLQDIGETGKEAARHIEETITTAYKVADKFCEKITACDVATCDHERKVEEAKRDISTASDKCLNTLETKYKEDLDELKKTYEADRKDILNRTDEAVTEVNKRKSEADKKVRIVRSHYEARVKQIWETVQSAAVSRQGANLIDLIEFSDSYEKAPEDPVEATLPLTLPSTPSLTVDRRKAKEIRAALRKLHWINFIHFFLVCILRASRNVDREDDSDDDTTTDSDENTVHHSDKDKTDVSDEEKAEDSDDDTTYDSDADNTCDSYKMAVVDGYWAGQLELVRKGVSNIPPGPPQPLDTSRPLDIADAKDIRVAKQGTRIHLWELLGGAPTTVGVRKSDGTSMALKDEAFLKDEAGELLAYFATLDNRAGLFNADGDNLLLLPAHDSVAAAVAAYTGQWPSQLMGVKADADDNLVVLRPDMTVRQWDDEYVGCFLKVTY